MNKNMVFYSVIAIAIAVVAYVAVLLSTQAGSVSLLFGYTNTSMLFPFNTTRFFIILNNTGSNYISGMLVGFYVNNKPYRNYNVSIPQGKSATIVVNYTYPIPGNYLFEAVADPARLQRLSSYNTTKASLPVRVFNATPANVIGSIPMKGIASSYIFDFPGSSMQFASLLYRLYNASPASAVFSPSGGILSTVVNNFYQLFNASHGIVASYANGSRASSVWIQGAAPESDVVAAIRSYGFRESDSNGIFMFYLPSNTTLCTYYSGGWTKMLSYTYRNGTCSQLVGIASQNYTALLDQYSTGFSNSSAIMNYSHNFIYTNSTVIGVQYGLSNYSRYTATWSWSNSANAIFVNYINESDAWSLLNRTCYGLLSNGTVCSEYNIPRGNSSATTVSAFITSRALVGNYLFELYSWVSNQSALNANYNAAKLLRAMAKNNSMLEWKSAYASSCAFNSTDKIGCNVTNFDSESHVATVQLTNLGTVPLRINFAACYVPGIQLNVTVSKSVLPGSSANFSLPCRSLVLFPVIGIRSSYLFYLNYTQGVRQKSIVGFLNTSNLV